MHPRVAEFFSVRVLTDWSAFPRSIEEVSLGEFRGVATGDQAQGRSDVGQAELV